MRGIIMAIITLTTLTANWAYAQQVKSVTIPVDALPPNYTLVPSGADQITVTAPFGANGTVVLLDVTEEPTPSPALVPATLTEPTFSMGFGATFGAYTVWDLPSGGVGPVLDIKIRRVYMQLKCLFGYWESEQLFSEFQQAKIQGLTVNFGAALGYELQVGSLKNHRVRLGGAFTYTSYLDPAAAEDDEQMRVRYYGGGISASYLYVWKDGGGKDLAALQLEPWVMVGGDMSYQTPGERRYELAWFASGGLNLSVFYTTSL